MPITWCTTVRCSRHAHRSRRDSRTLSRSSPAGAVWSPVAAHGRGGHRCPGHRFPEVLLEPLHEQVECVVVLFAEPEPVRGHGHELMPRLVARTVAQQEFTCELFARVEEVGYPGVVSLLLLEQPFLGNLLVALCVLVVLEVENVPGVAGHRVDVASNDFIQILELLVIDD